MAALTAGGSGPAHCAAVPAPAHCAGTREAIHGCTGAEPRHVRLCRGGRRVGGMRARQPPQRGPRCARPAPRGGRLGPLALDSHSGGVPLLHGQPPRGLVLLDRERSGIGGPRDSLSARPGAGWQFVHQRHDLHARPCRGLRPLAPTRQRGLVLGGCAPVLHPRRGSLAGWRFDAWPGRRVAGRTGASPVGHPRRISGSCPRGGHPADRGFQSG